MQHPDIELHTGANGLAEGQQYDINVMDLLKAFAHIPHHLLLHKAKYLVVQRPLIAWVRSFFHQISQRVLVDVGATDICGVISGVPRGTMLGTVLFILLINDRPSVINNPLQTIC